MGIWEVRFWKFLWFVLGGVLVGFACYFLLETLGHVRAAREQGDTLVSMAKQYGPPIAEDMRELTASVTDAAPKIVEDVQVVTDAAAVAARDVHDFRELVAGPSVKGQTGKLAYATSVISAIEKSGGKIATKAIIGNRLKGLEDGKQWAHRARREAGVLVLMAETKHELLVRLCRSALRADFFITFDEGKTRRKLVDWLAAHHPETAEVMKSVAAAK